MRKCEDFADEDDRGARQKQRYEFCRKVRGGIHNRMAEQIQVPGPSVHQDVVSRLNASCELCRDELGAHLNWLRGIQGQLDEGSIT